jgi:hypothetical protein
MQTKSSKGAIILDISHLLCSIYIILAIFSTLIQASLRASYRAYKSDGTALHMHIHITCKNVLPRILGIELNTLELRCAHP